MRYRRKENLSWRKLDNYAKLFPLATTKNFINVFRISVVLKEEINQELLEKAVKIALNKFKYFKVRLRKGIFWYYFENNNKSPIVSEESEYPCKFMDLPLNNDYLFKVTYFDCKINLEIFHCLTDGNGAINFLKEIIYNYIEMRYLENISTSRSKEREIKFNVEDSYIKNYDNKIKAQRETQRAYILNGKILPPGVVAVTHEFINSKKVRDMAKANGCTVTQFLTACLVFSIYEVGAKIEKSNKNIIIQVPVNLKKYFPSETSSNFFSYIDVNIKTNEYTTFFEILNEVKKQFDFKLKKEEILKTISINLKLSNNFILRLVPLFLKKLVVSIVHREFRKYNTTTLSNVGRIGIIQEYKPYIDKFLLLIGPENIEKIKCTVCAYEDVMVVSFTSVLEDKKVENKFKEVLENFGISVQLDGNEV